MEKHDLMEVIEKDRQKKKQLKKEFMHECALLVIGYFNQYLNGEKVVYGKAADVQDDGKMNWHAKLINRGGFGSVLRVTKRNEKTYEIEGVRAIKVVPRNIMGQSEAMKSVQLGSNFVVKVFNVFMIRQMSCIEMEFLEEGSLKDLIDNKETIPTSTISKMLHQCSEVLSRMRQLNIVHSDIKPDNIMIQNKNFDIAVGDFGLSFNDQLLIESTKGGTSGYIAPEVLNGEQPSFFSDLYSLGVTFEELYECADYDVDLNEIIKKLQSEAPREREKAFYEFNSEWILQRKEISHVWENDVGLISTILDMYEFKKSLRHILSFTELEGSIGFRLNIGESLKKNVDFIMNFNLFIIAHPSLTSDSEIMLKAIEQNHYNFHYADQKLRFDSKFVLEAVTRRNEVYQCCGFKDNREIVLEAVGKFSNFQSLDKQSEFRSDEEIILKAIKNMSSDEIAKCRTDDRDILLKLLSIHGIKLEYVASRVRDKEMEMVAVRQNGLALQFVEHLDYRIVFVAVQQNGIAIQFADKFRNEVDIILEAIKQNEDAKKFVPANFSEFHGATF